MNINGDGGKPPVIGLYGIQGVGKSTLMDQLRQMFGEEDFRYYDGSDKLASFLPGGIAEFKTLLEDEKIKIREKAISLVAEECGREGKIGLVSGHLMFWTEGTEPEIVITPMDLKVYTHIFYLSVPAEAVYERRNNDQMRRRSPASVEHLKAWSTREEQQLRELCLQHRILFTSVEKVEDKIPKLLLQVRDAAPSRNTSLALQALEATLGQVVQHVQSGDIKTMVVLDADRTLGPLDSGKELMKKAAISSSLESIFTEWGYTFEAFRLASYLFEEAFGDDTLFEDACQIVAKQDGKLYSEIASLLGQAVENPSVAAIVVTCGAPHVWRSVLANEGFNNQNVPVIGGVRLSDGFVVSPQTKADLVNYMRKLNTGLKICVVGDSPLDIPMMQCAHKAVVVVGPEPYRSKSMPGALKEATESNTDFHPSLAWLPASNGYTLEKTFPLVDHLIPKLSSRIHILKDAAARLLATPMRDSSCSGHVLREAHATAGEHIARELIANIIGLERCEIRHVQGHTTEGHRLRNEENTLIVGIARAGAPMAEGVSKAFSQAKLLEVDEPKEKYNACMDGMKNVILVDAVINSGGTIVKFIEWIRSVVGDQMGGIRVVIAAGVVQEKAIERGGVLEEVLYGRVGLDASLALRTSENKFTGTRGTDTGNRLYNTTDLR